MYNLTDRLQSCQYRKTLQPTEEADTGMPVLIFEVPLEWGNCKTLLSSMLKTANILCVSYEKYGVLHNCYYKIYKIKMNVRKNKLFPKRPKQELRKFMAP